MSTNLKFVKIKNLGMFVSVNSVTGMIDNVTNGLQEMQKIPLEQREGVTDEFAQGMIAGANLIKSTFQEWAAKSEIKIEIDQTERGQNDSN